MMAAMIPTVLGPISPDALGITLMHEHLLCDITPPSLRGRPEFAEPITLANRYDIDYGRRPNATKSRMLDRELAVAEVLAFQRDGGEAIVELSIGGLALVVIDPLQAFSGGLEINDPGHCQFIVTTFGRLAALCGCSVIITHHVRKTKITNAEEAREAVRGSGGLLDAVRSTVVVWPAPEDDAKTVCRKLGTVYDRDKVANLAVVMANFKKDSTVRTLVRDEGGLLLDRTAELTHDAPNYGAALDMLVLAIATAAAENRPLTKTGKSGVWKRRHELPSIFHDKPKTPLEEMVGGLIEHGRLCCFSLPGVSKSRQVWLAATNDQIPFSGGSENK